MHVISKHLVTNLLCITVVLKYCRVTNAFSLVTNVDVPGGGPFSVRQSYVPEHAKLQKRPFCVASEGQSEGHAETKWFLRYSVRVCLELHNLERSEILIA
jgi:hypothetical protein